MFRRTSASVRAFFVARMIQERSNFIRSPRNASSSDDTNRQSACSRKYGAVGRPLAKAPSPRFVTNVSARNCDRAMSASSVVVFPASCV
jgi:hypothetical protein